MTRRRDFLRPVFIALHFRSQLYITLDDMIKLRTK